MVSPARIWYCKGVDRFVDLPRGQLHALLAPRPSRGEWMTHLIARLALAGSVRVLDGGNRFDSRGLSRELRRLDRNFYLPLRRVRVARAFTCFQAVTLLLETPPLRIPTLALDLLITFEDESVSLAERLRLLDVSLARLRALSRQALVIVSAPPPTPDDTLLSRLQDAADHVWRFEPEAAPSQPRLF